MSNLLDGFNNCKLNSWEWNKEDVFVERKDKTLDEIIKGSKYSKLAPVVNNEYVEFLKYPIGNFLLYLKSNGDEFYKEFLYKRNGVVYGAGPFCHFNLEDTALSRESGIYAFFSYDDIENPKYIGKTEQGQSFKTRVNNGHGKITGGMCYLSGQRTSCRVNYHINKIGKPMKMIVMPMNCSDDEIDNFETKLIRELDPPWNIMKRNWIKHYQKQKSQN